MELKHNLKIILIDDEEKSRLILKKLIEEYIEEATVIAMASDVLEGVKAIHRFNPDVVFLDIEMPNYSGFKLIDYFDEIYDSTNTDLQNEKRFEVVFTTAYEKYAIKAIKASAIGYLLKPIDIDELIDVFKKVRKKINDNPLHTQLDESNLDASQRIVFPTQSGLIYLQANEICYIESSGRYTDIHLINNEKLISTLSLKDCLAKVANSTFIRIHRSFIINLSYIHNYSRGRDSFVIMDNKAKVGVGLFYKDDLNKTISFFLK